MEDMVDEDDMADDMSDDDMKAAKDERKAVGTGLAVGGVAMEGKLVL